MAFRRKLLCLNLLLFLGACQFSVDYSQGYLQCAQDNECPQTFVCQAQRCLPGQCAQNNECPAEYRCTQGKCVLANPPKPCKQQRDCDQAETCAPSEQGALCVPRCDAALQRGCPDTQVCVLIEARGYCADNNNAAQVQVRCNSDTPCQPHLLCRNVKGFPAFQRCTTPCDLRQNGKDCSTQGQTCIPIPNSAPMGYCEPTPPVAQSGEDCGEDITCAQGTSCQQEQDQQRCVP